MANTQKTKRNFGLDTEDVQRLQTEYATNKKLPNPYRAGGCYHMIVAALSNMGIDKPHKANEVMVRMQKEAGREWTREWKNKDKRTKEGLDAEGRFLQNIRVLQRTADFGKKLLEVGKIIKSKGVVIDLTRDGRGKLFIALNTNSNSPMKPGRAQTKPQTAKTKKATAK